MLHLMPMGFSFYGEENGKICFLYLMEAKVMRADILIEIMDLTLARIAVIKKD